jgi:hypothetical protein
LQETALQEEAQQQEKLKDWPGALASYQNLTQLNGTLSSDATAQASRLKAMIDTENDLFGQAQGAAASGNFLSAQGVYQQVADLHGDREQEAVDATHRMGAELKSANAKPAVVEHQPLPAVHPKAPSQAAKKAPPEQTASNSPSTTPAPPQKLTENCQLIATDIPRYLDMADNNRGRGKYSDAEREYNSVLQCDSENDRARSGLARTRQAEAIPSSPSGR